MPDQLSVHRNPGRNRQFVPFVVVVQCNRFRDSTHRVIVPLLAAEAFGQPDSDIGPHFRIAGRDVVLAPLQITNIPRDALGDPVGSLDQDEHRIVNALDALLSRAWR